MTESSDTHDDEIREQRELLADSLLKFVQAEDESERRTQLQAIARQLHTMKGIFGFANEAARARDVHEAENWIQLYREGREPLDEVAVQRIEERLQGVLQEQQEPLSVRSLDPEERQLALALQNEGQKLQEVVLAHGKVGPFRSWLKEQVRILKATPEPRGEEMWFRFLVVGLDPRLLEGREETVKLNPVTLPEGNVEPSSEPRESAEPGSVVSARVSTVRLDRLVNTAGALTVEVHRLRNELGRHHPAVQGLERLAGQLRQEVLDARLTPVRGLFQRLALELRQRARAKGGPVRVELAGESVEIDRQTVEKLAEPLRHLLLNALVHGLETPDERAAVDKEPVGRVRLSAARRGRTVVLEVGDDGRGLELSGDEAETLEKLCQPGYSAKGAADLEAGRGLGLDIVRRSARELRGHLSLRSELGKGSVFSLEIPLSLSLIHACLFRHEGQTYAIDRDLVSGVLETEEVQIKSGQGRRWVVWEEGRYPYHEFQELIGLPSAPVLQVIRMERGGRYSFLGVTRVHDIRELVVQSPSDPLLGLPWLTGVSQLGDGGVALLLDPDGLRGGAL